MNEKDLTTILDRVAHKVAEGFADLETGDLASAVNEACALLTEEN